jgi:hypothetical protein
MEPLMLAWASQAERAGHDLNEDYRLAMCRYVLDMAQNILSGELKLTRESHNEYRLMMEFYWLLHKIPEYLLRTNSEGCAEGVMFTGFRLAGIRELWELMGGDQSAGVQTMKRRMILQLEELEKRGCVRIDQVWHIPTQLQVQAQTDRVIINLDTQLATTFSDMIKQAKFVIANIKRAEAWRQKVQSKGQGGEEEHKKREERCSSVESTEIVGAKAAEKGKAKATKRPTKRVKEEVGEERPRLAKREVAVAHPDYMTATPELRQKNKQKEGTYRLDYESHKGVAPPRNRWLVRRSRGGAFSPKGLLWVRIPPVVEVCRRVLGTETGKSEAYEIYVPLPGDKVFRLNSMKDMWDQCYALGARGMFLDERDVGGDIIRQWHKEPNTQVKDTEEALLLLDKWAQEHPSDAVDEYGPAVASPTTGSGAAESTQTVVRTTRTSQERTVRVTPLSTLSRNRVPLGRHRGGTGVRV